MAALKFQVIFLLFHLAMTLSLPTAKNSKGFKNTKCDVIFFRYINLFVFFLGEKLYSGLFTNLDFFSIF